MTTAAPNRRTETERSRWAAALLLVGLLLSVVVSTDPLCADVTSPASGVGSHRFDIVETVTAPGATASAVAMSSGAIAGNVAGAIAGVATPDSRSIASALTSSDRARSSTRATVSPAALTDRPAPVLSAESGTDSLLVRVGASIAAVVSGLTPNIPPAAPTSMFRRIAEPIDGSAGLSGSAGGPSFAVLNPLAPATGDSFTILRFIDDRARLAWAFVAPLQRPG